MSQYNRTAEGGDPSVPTSFVTDDGTAVPTANTLNVLGRDTNEDNANGIQTVADPNGGDDLYVELTNRVYGTASVTGAVTGDIITFDLGASSAVYRFILHVTGRDTSTNDAVGYTILGSVKTDGATATVIETPFQDADEDTALIDAQMAFVASGNNVILQATGVAGQTISYAAYGYYIKI